jgi:hypothetical protein
MGVCHVDPRNTAGNRKNFPAKQAVAAENDPCDIGLAVSSVAWAAPGTAHNCEANHPAIVPCIPAKQIFPAYRKYALDPQRATMAGP